MRFIDLFAGAGGLSEGFMRAGFEPIAHVEMDEAACNTLRTRQVYQFLKKTGRIKEYESYLKGEINRTELYSLVPEKELARVINLAISTVNNKKIFDSVDNLLGNEKVDLIIGGPPCQAYSLVGRARSANKMEGDPRNYLYVQYADFLQKYQPKMFVFENVLGLKSAKSGLYLRNMEKLFFKKGYEMRQFTLEANNFGVLQRRKRIIIVGWKKELNLTIPELDAIRTPKLYTVKEVFSDLPKLHAGDGIDKFTTYSGKANTYLSEAHIRNGINTLTQHVTRPHTEQDKEIYRIAVDKWNNSRERLNYNDLPERLKTHQNRDSFFDRFKVVADTEYYSQTVVAHIAKDGHYYIHPDISQNRSISVREAARLQTFPDDYYFEGVKEGSNRTAAFKQIGNAVPPLMAEYIANSLLKFFSNTYSIGLF
jgi:DNA (cytosine-5)-methyltransferase 1